MPHILIFAFNKTIDGSCLELRPWSHIWLFCLFLCFTDQLLSCTWLTSISCSILFQQMQFWALMSPYSSLAVNCFPYCCQLSCDIVNSLFKGLPCCIYLWLLDGSVFKNYSLLTELIFSGPWLCNWLLTLLQTMWTLTFMYSLTNIFKHPCNYHPGQKIEQYWYTESLLCMSS